MTSAPNFAKKFVSAVFKIAKFAIEPWLPETGRKTLARSRQQRKRDFLRSRGTDGSIRRGTSTLETQQGDGDRSYRRGFVYLRRVGMYKQTGGIDMHV